MNVRRFSSGDHSGQNPAWYWSKGLHDAKILRTEALTYDLDYRQKKPVRNALIFHLDSTGAMFDTGVKAIRFLNYKIILDDSANGAYETGKIDGCYWMQDVLTWENGKYILNFILLGEDDFQYAIRFEDAQVERNDLNTYKKHRN